jgi:hypothetical protein
MDKTAEEYFDETFENKLKNLRWYSSFIILMKKYFLMLEELAKNHDKWLRMAMSICGIVTKLMT